MASHHAAQMPNSSMRPWHVPLWHLHAALRDEPTMADPPAYGSLMHDSFVHLNMPSCRSDSQSEQGKLGLIG